VKIKGNRLKVESGNQLGTLYADYHKVRQVLFNILNNAVKFTNQGTITFTITRRCQKNPQTELSPAEKGGADGGEGKTEHQPLSKAETEHTHLEKHEMELPRLKTSETQYPPLEKEGKEALSDWLFFQVADTGMGIPSEKLNMVFEAFTQADNSSTREFGGTGLGLAISEHFCKAMGGKISVCSTQDEGTTFTVQLPAQVSVK